MIVEDFKAFTQLFFEELNLKLDQLPLNYINIQDWIN